MDKEGGRIKTTSLEDANLLNKDASITTLGGMHIEKNLNVGTINWKAITTVSIIPSVGLTNKSTAQTITITSKVIKQNTIKAGDYYTFKLSGDFNFAPNTTIQIKLVLNSSNILVFADSYSHLHPSPLGSL